MQIPAWLVAIAAILGSVSLVWALVRLWYRRLARTPAWDDPPPPEPATVRDAFAATLSEEHGHRRPGPRALRDGERTIAPLDPDVAVLWSARFGDRDPVFLYEEATDAGLIVAVTGWTDAPDVADLAAQISGRFGVAARCVAGNGNLYAAVASTSAIFDRLSLVAGLTWLKSGASGDDAGKRAAPAAVSVFVDGVELGCLPPFGRLVHRGEAIWAVTTCALSHRYRAEPRLTFQARAVEVPRTSLATATSEPPADPLGPGVQVRVLGGDVAKVIALASRPAGS